MKGRQGSSPSVVIWWYLKPVGTGRREWYSLGSSNTSLYEPDDWHLVVDSKVKGWGMEKGIEEGIEEGGVEKEGEVEKDEDWMLRGVVLVGLWGIVVNVNV